MDDLTLHLILFSKGHYGRTKKGIVNDLRTFMSKWAAMDIKYYPDKELYEIVVDAFVESCSKREIQTHLKGMKIPTYRYLLQTKPMTTRQSIVSMLGLMGCLQIMEQDKDGNLYDLITLPEVKTGYMITGKGVQGR